MNNATPIALPPFVAPMRFDDPQAALAQVQRIYADALAHLRDHLRRYAAGEAYAGLDADAPWPRVRAHYPFVRIEVSERTPVDPGLAWGFVAGPGRFETTVTRPDLFGPYLLAQFTALRANHGVAIEVGTSHQPIPLPFAGVAEDSVEADLPEARRQRLREVFDLPDLSAMDDGIANGTAILQPGEAQPLALFTAPRVDYSLHRLRHYTGTAPEWFQNFVLFTNYQFYIDEFVALAEAEMDRPDSDYLAFVAPGNVVTWRRGLPEAERAAWLAAPQGVAPARLPQMPAWHLLRADRSGISMVNIGVGPSNAKTITDHIAVLRPHAWIMLGHCAGLRNSQRLGDYVLAHAYVREDHVLDEELPLWVPIPALAEVQVALETAVEAVTGLEGAELKRVLRTGTVASTDNRNWELLPSRDALTTPERRFSQSRAIALDMESATLAANGFRFRVPYGTLLCVSDKPLHGEIKLPGMANAFYRERVGQHLRIGLAAVERLRAAGPERLHSRKLRSFNEVAFQ
ncbi:AMP nucleosidase [Tibeticola sp.]|jgi:AMP nucleosidase|uniref:AMP nucleosidase n=1 Tax=Tibeticola sp. TaxID=2005368 RepID=UPI00258AF7C4|nr:AMP nucleosidase [Tibeticola sp.]MCI4440509.1 AMP nucleosidase [Tibeticola sp.]